MMKTKNLVLTSLLTMGTVALGHNISPASAASSLAVAKDGPAIAKELSQRNAGYGDMKASLEMRLRNANGQEARRAMRIQSMERSSASQGDYSIVVFDSPSDVRGTALLSHAGILKPDDQWLYMPALKRVRRISTRNTSGPFVGSEFSYEDITGTEVGKYSWKLLGTEACGRATCYKLETKPQYERSGYTRRIVWVEQGEFRVHKIEFYDRKNTELKTLTYSDYKKYDGKYWRAHSWKMVNHQSGKSTELVFDDIKFKTGMKESDFTQKALESIR